MKIPEPIIQDCEILTVRTFNAPRAKVYKAFSDPDHLKNWWGPAGFTNTFNEFELKEGGKWNFTMHGPEKGNYVNSCEFTDLEFPSLIAWKRYSQPLFRVIIMFEEVNSGQTKIIFRQVFETAKECSKIRPYVEDKNEENMDRLEVELKKVQT
jgi:uncharacterized protein YndB with AHSA1/START domain